MLYWGGVTPCKSDQINPLFKILQWLPSTQDQIQLFTHAVAGFCDYYLAHISALSPVGLFTDVTPDAYLGSIHTKPLAVQLPDSTPLPTLFPPPGMAFPPLRNESQLMPALFCEACLDLLHLLLPTCVVPCKCHND